MEASNAQQPRTESAPPAAAPDFTALGRGFDPPPADAEPPRPPETIVLFGNSSPQMQVLAQQPDGTHRQVSLPAPHLDQSVTRAEMWPGFDDEEFVKRTLSTPNDRFLTMIARGLSDADKKYAVGISECDQVVNVHTGGNAPDWVASNDPEFARVLADHFGCSVGEPTALVTNGGRDAVHAQAMSTSAQPAAFNYMALANSATAVVPGATDTTLVGEITTGGGGLVRAQATYAHTAGTNTTTLTKTFTANGTDALPVTISQDGIFNASSSGTLAYKDALNANATLTTSGDNVTITHTVNIG